MCESTVYDTNDNLLMEDAISIKIEGEKIILLDIMNQKKVVEGSIIEIDLEKHDIFIKINS
jgi:predicted RNA-binding protein